MLVNPQESMHIQNARARVDPELAALDGDRAKAQAELDGARKGTQDAELRRAELEGKIESYRVMQERRRQRLERGGGGARGPGGGGRGAGGRKRSGCWRSCGRPRRPVARPPRLARPPAPTGWRERAGRGEAAPGGAHGGGSRP